jgi:hypothetical protein
MLLRLNLICFFILSFLESSSQKIGTKESIFGWIPSSPTDFIRQNHKKYLSNDEYKRLLNCYALAFDADVDLYNTKIVSVKYSDVNEKLNEITKSPNLDADIARKVEKALLDNIGVTKVKRISVIDSIPKGIYRYAITLDFNEKDRRRAKKLK